MLRLMTFCSFHVVQSCGRYWIQARIAAHSPRMVAQVWRMEGYQSRKTLEVMRRTMKCETEMNTTLTAVFHVGGAGASAGCGSGPGLGKKMRKRNMLGKENSQSVWYDAMTGL
jgi:hypothetical protein